MSDIKSHEIAEKLYGKSFIYEDKNDLQRALEIRKSLVEYDGKNEKYLLAFARSLALVKRLEEAEYLYRKSIFIYPYSELSSLHLFYFLFDNNKTDGAFDEMRRFQSISHSDDYDEFVKTINSND